MRFGFVGWRGMVGSVLRERMDQAGDWEHFEARYFSTSNAGGEGPDGAPLADAHDLAALEAMPIIVTCQGGSYTKKVYDPLRARGWSGVWIDASSALRLRDESTLILDPVNRDVIDAALTNGGRTWCGPNCTVSLMLMGLTGLFRSGLVEWVSTMTYQAASGAGAKAMRELVAQMRQIGQAAGPILDDPAQGILAVDRAVAQAINGAPAPAFGAPLAGSAIPWVGDLMPNGQSQEEFKGAAETNKILGHSARIGVDGVCVRIGAMRCHAQGLTLKLKADAPLAEIESLIRDDHEWAKVVPNTPEATRAHLTPAATTGSLTVPVGRLRWLDLGPRMLGAFTVGDQLLWGAAEPLRRMLRILAER